MRTQRQWMVIAFCLATWMAFPAAGTPPLIDRGQRLGDGTSWSVALGDIDGDGDLDAVVADFASQGSRFDAEAIIWLNDGTGLFAESGQRLLQAGNHPAVALADFDRDGSLDILLGLGDQAARIWWNDGDGAFSESLMLNDIKDCVFVATGDFDGDGLPDIAAGTNGRNPVLRNNGNRTFTRTQQLGNIEPAGGIAVGDMDEDGDIDIVDVGWYVPCKIWFNDGSGRFRQHAQFGPSQEVFHTVAVADWEGDGDLDVLLPPPVPGGAFMPSASVWLNDGTGQLSIAQFDFGSQQESISVDSIGIAVVDVDLDGNLDAVFASMFDPHALEIWFGAGEAGFSGASIRVGEGAVPAVAAGDLDGDGDIDFFIAQLVAGSRGYEPHPNAVWWNTAR